MPITISGSSLFSSPTSAHRGPGSSHHLGSGGLGVQVEPSCKGTWGPDFSCLTLGWESTAGVLGLLENKQLAPQPSGETCQFCTFFRSVAGSSRPAQGF